MSISEAIEAINRKENGKYRPLDGIETEKLFSFFMVTNNGEAVGNNAQYIVTKDGKYCDWFTAGIPIPFLMAYPEYKGKVVKQWSQGEIKQLLRRRKNGGTREKALKAFSEYADNFDRNIIEIQLKIDHTYRVADIAERIAGSTGADPEFSWYLGLLHDIARFEQYTKYGTFRDALSVDHAELGADLLFGRDRLIDIFSLPVLPGASNETGMLIAEKAIRFHNKLTLPEGLDADTRMYCDILRDADKCDIFRVLTEPPYDVRNLEIAGSDTPASEEIMAGVMEHRCVSRIYVKNPFESLLGQCCMFFELVYPESIAIVREQGYLEKMIDIPVKNDKMKKQMDLLKQEIRGAYAI